jgi:hypothetical protein
MGAIVKPFKAEEVLKKVQFRGSILKNDEISGRNFFLISGIE